MVDTTEFTPEEEERLVQAQATADMSAAEISAEEQADISIADETSSADAATESDEH
jgi:hypothetical protein